MTKIQLRRGTAAQWTSVNPILASGEMGIETDTNKFKFGDGTTAWNSLDYVITGEVITDYRDLSNLPSINNITLTGNKSSSDLGLQNELTNGTGILISGDTISVDDSVVAMQSDIPDVSNFVTNSSLSATLQDYQPLLESGTNIKTINNLSLLGSGNIEIQSGGTYSEGTGIDITNGVISIDSTVVALKSDIPSLTGYATEQWVQNQNYLTSSALNGYATESFVTSQGYITSSALNGYATQTWVTNQNYVNNTTLTNTLADYVLSADLASVATSGDYDDLINKPTIPSAVTESTVSGWGFTKNKGTVTSVNNIAPVNGNVSITIPDNTTFMDLSTNQTAYGTKTFNDLRVHQYIRNVAGKIIFYGVGSSFSIGDTTCELTLDGSTIRPYYYNGTVNSEMALLSDIPTVPDIDNTTITKNTDDELQTVAVIDNNSGGALKYWTGTKAQYDAIVTKDSNTIYNITDDTDVTLALLELLFPVGAVYFGTMATCPLQTLGVGTWQALPSDKVIQIAGTRGSVDTTINESLPNVKGEVSVRRQNNSGVLSYSAEAFYNGGLGGATDSIFYSTDTTSQYQKVKFDASRSSSTYQDNAPVQQDAYLLNGWRRIA